MKISAEVKSLLLPEMLAGGGQKYIFYKMEDAKNDR